MCCTNQPPTQLIFFEPMTRRQNMWSAWIIIFCGCGMQRCDAIGWCGDRGRSQDEGAAGVKGAAWGTCSASLEALEGMTPHPMVPSLAMSNRCFSPPSHTPSCCAQAKQAQLAQDKRKAEEERLLASLPGNLGFSRGRPLAAIAIFRCCLQWRAFQVRSGPGGCKQPRNEGSGLRQVDLFTDLSPDGMIQSLWMKRQGEHPTAFEPCPLSQAPGLPCLHPEPGKRDPAVSLQCPAPLPPLPPRRPTERHCLTASSALLAARSRSSKTTMPRWPTG